MSSSQGESAPKRFESQAETSEMHQMNQKLSNYVSGMALDAWYELQNAKCEDRVCNTVFSRSVQKLKRYLLNEIFECSENQLRALKLHTFPFLVVRNTSQNTFLLLSTTF